MSPSTSVSASVSGAFFPAPKEPPPSSPSYVHGASPIPLIGLTVGRLLDDAVARLGDGEALVAVEQGRRLTYRELGERVDAVAAGLLALGLGRGERIAVWSPNRVEWILLQFATAKAGLVLVNVNPACRAPELEFALRRVGCAALVTSARFKTTDYGALLREVVPEIDAAPSGRLRAERLPELRSVIGLDPGLPAGVIPLEEVIAGASPSDVRRVAELEAELDFDDPINIQFTSGTTGEPKPATLTHHGIVNNARLSAARMKFGPEDRLCLPVPMYHCFGMVLGSLACVSSGATLVLPSAGFDPEATLRAIEAERCTAVHGVPTMFFRMRESSEFDRGATTSLRTGIMAGAPCPEELMRRVMREMHLGEITIAYGMTETGPVSFQTSVDDPLERRVETVGRVLPHTEAKVVDEAGRIVPRGCPGELCTRGYLVMDGYWEDPDRTIEAIDRAGWMHTGDLATIDEEGYGRIVGRIKDMIIRGGENVFPREIEDFLYGHPDIEEVEVFGVPDPDLGEEVCAWILPREGRTLDEASIHDFCRDRIAHFKIPRHIRFVEEFPLTATGKVRKFVMRDRMIEELGRAAAG